MAPAATAASLSPTTAPARANLWAVNFEPVEIYSGPDEASVKFGVLRQFIYLDILDYEGDWAKVYDVRWRTTGWVRGNLLGPSEPPPAYLIAPPPPAVAEINLPGRIVGEAHLTFFPTLEEAARVLRLGHNAVVNIKDAVIGEDGETWYRTTDGDYVAPDAVRLPRTPPHMFSGRWLDVDLSEPVMLTAYEDDRPVASMLAIKGVGSWPTPTGVFSIQRRVANETMDSATIGIPRNAPGGYHLENVLFTQYFLGSGESIHYNYWSGNFGYAGSHGCLGLNYDDSEFLWHWADVGTPVSIHY